MKPEMDGSRRTGRRMGGMGHQAISRPCDGRQLWERKERKRETFDSPPDAPLLRATVRAGMHRVTDRRVALCCTGSVTSRTIGTHAAHSHG
ncbi:hypothetical protein E2C01_039588 [Portunus trituberculatus]|uniref:Uncharacterized protein n=1 Tax=Portunus trituberculatus TaxID=210409 RepID=A0A5B7FH80_PORTR|nr:hypothetical protein [Portunus trituberculatus]